MASDNQSPMNLATSHVAEALLEAGQLGLPFVQLSATLANLRQMGVEPGEISLAEFLPGSQGEGADSQITGLIGACSQIDLSTGPMVLRIPANLTGVVVDAGFRVVVDIGNENTGTGAPREFLLSSPDIPGDGADGYIRASSPTLNNLLALFGRSANSDRAGLIATIQQQLNIFSPKFSRTPPPEIFHRVSARETNPPCQFDLGFFRSLDAVVQTEPSASLPSRLSDALAIIGIRKGRQFAPDDAMAASLAKIAQAMARQPSAPLLKAWSRALSFPDNNQSYSLEPKFSVPSAGSLMETGHFSICNLTIRRSSKC